jgi:hypothetical protein
VHHQQLTCVLSLNYLKFTRILAKWCLPSTFSFPFPLNSLPRSYFPCKPTRGRRVPLPTMPLPFCSPSHHRGTLSLCHLRLELREKGSPMQVSPCLHPLPLPASFDPQPACAIPPSWQQRPHVPETRRIDLSLSPFPRLCSSWPLDTSRSASTTPGPVASPSDLPARHRSIPRYVVASDPPYTTQ